MLLKLLLGVEAAFVGARLLQIVFPLQVPRVLQAWVLWPTLWDTPLDPRRVSPFTALIPWLLWAAVLVLWLEVLRRASGQRVFTRMQALAVALVPGYAVVGLPRLMALMAAVLGPLAAGFKAGARGIVGLHVLVAFALVVEARRDTPDWGLVVLCADGALLLAQWLTLRTVARALLARTAHPRRWRRATTRPHRSSRRLRLPTRDSTAQSAPRPRRCDRTRASPAITAVAAKAICSLPRRGDSSSPRRENPRRWRRRGGT
ncbi:hypothetical protein QEG98_38100 [Myxococcus sp. MxC21-1]|uniref:hypothetical protein n=1 Tax=Myxococcus sp. MxC21-1 TaxID=3041439 RepID=UPI00292EC1C9|nr:hypothetical protein [Myxococcus sp. MxC21-1]WNZ61614.1 hypothetical protein QEG98_38100 [Myxococcus sp. MxC21-1]